MKKIFLIVITTAIFNSNGALAAKTTYYCAPNNQINFTAQSLDYAPYLYTSPQALTHRGVQPSLIGWGSAHQAVEMMSADWTDGSLACNYLGLTDQLKNEIMVMVSNPLASGDEISCTFPGGNGFCDSTNPYDCPLMCEEPRT